MVDQTSVNGRGTTRGPGSGPAAAEFDGVAEFVDDLATLAELQANLAAIDFREAARKSAVPIVLTVVGLTVVMASVPVALLGAGWLLASALKIHQGWAMLLTAGAAMALAGLVAGVGGMRLRHSFDSFRRSRKQLWLNLSWIRTVLVTSASTRTHPRRRS
jgi:Putative Actinobacterial Holin-X, holin superfamily III